MERLSPNASSKLNNGLGGRRMRVVAKRSQEPKTWLEFLSSSTPGFGNQPAHDLKLRSTAAVVFVSRARRAAGGAGVRRLVALRFIGTSVGASEGKSSHTATEPV